MGLMAVIGVLGGGLFKTVKHSYNIYQKEKEKSGPDWAFFFLCLWAGYGQPQGQKRRVALRLPALQ
ncbi:hypothetical protein ACVGWI_00125, partial [Enterobacter hormaechei]